MKQRMHEFDMLRVFAALSVIGIHTTGSFTQSSTPAFFLNQLARYSVPLFIVISGVLLFHADSGRKSLPYLQFLSKRLRKVLIPYIAWTMIYMIYNYRNEMEALFTSPFRWADVLYEMLIHGWGYYHLYFVIIILQLYLLYPLLRILILRYPTLTLSVTFLMTFLAQTLIYLSELKLLQLPRIIWLQNYMTFPVWIFFFTFGMYFCIRREKWKMEAAGKLLPLAIVWGISLGLLLADGLLTHTTGSSIKPSVMLYCIASFLFFCALVSRIKAFSPSTQLKIQWLSSQSFLFYLVHPLIIAFLKPVYYRLGIDFLWTKSINMVILFCLTTGFSALFAYLTSFLPFASLLGGIRSHTESIKFHTQLKA